MTPEEVISAANAMNENGDYEILLMEPQEQFNPCLVGIVERFNSVFVVYSKKCILESLAAEMDPDPDYPPDIAALEHYSFNIVGGWVGDGTPAFMLDEEA